MYIYSKQGNVNGNNGCIAFAGMDCCGEPGTLILANRMHFTDNNRTHLEHLYVANDI